MKLIMLCSNKILIFINQVIIKWQATANFKDVYTLDYGKRTWSTLKESEYSTPTLPVALLHHVMVTHYSECGYNYNTHSSITSSSVTSVVI